MFERFTEGARQAVVLAQDEARGLRHDYIGTEHLLLGLLREGRGLAALTLTSLGVSLEAAREQTRAIVGEGDEVRSGPVPFSPRAKKVLELSLREALALGHNDIDTEHVLLGLVRTNEGAGARILLDFDADPDAIRNELTRRLGRSGGRRPGGGHARSAPPPQRPARAWEYRIERWPGADLGEHTDELNALGSDGWELDAALPGDGAAQLVFRRPAPPATPAAVPVTVGSGVTLGELGTALGVPAAELFGLLAEIDAARASTIVLSDREVEIVADRLGRRVTIRPAASADG